MTRKTLIVPCSGTAKRTAPSRAKAPTSSRKTSRPAEHAACAAGARCAWRQKSPRGAGTSPAIAIDGCKLSCAAKVVAVGGTVARALQALDVYRRNRHLQPAGIAELNEAGITLIHPGRGSVRPGRPRRGGGRECLNSRNGKSVSCRVRARNGRGDGHPARDPRSPGVAAPERPRPFAFRCFWQGARGIAPSPGFIRPLRSRLRETLCGPGHGDVQREAGRLHRGERTVPGGGGRMERRGD